MGMRLSPEQLPFTPMVPKGGSLSQDIPTSYRRESGILVQKQKTYHLPTATKATTCSVPSTKGLQWGSLPNVA